MTQGPYFVEGDQQASKRFHLTIWFEKHLPLLSVLTLAFLATLWGTWPQPSVLNPTRVDWILNGSPDLFANWLGAHYFRASPLLQWPLGANPYYGLEISTTIVYCDPIPILAYSAKALNFLLPPMFQYMGPWFLICMLLQAYFAWKLLGNFTRDRWLPVLGTIPFLLSPPMMFRFPMHAALVGHWVILAAFCLYFSGRQYMLRWALLFALSALIHPYLLLMCLAIFLSDVIHGHMSKERNIAQSARVVFISLGLLFLTMWSAGYFDGTPSAASGFGRFKANLLTFLDSNGWSVVLPDLPNASHDEREGFAYLGLGTIGALLFSLAVLSLDCKSRGYPPKSVSPLVIVTAAAAIFALSNQISFGSHSDVVTYKLPGVVVSKLGIFRGSGRFIWLPYYGLLIFACYTIFRCIRTRFATIILLLWALVQTADISQGTWLFNERFYSAKQEWNLSSPVWDCFPRYYENVRYDIPVHASNDSPKWKYLAYFAARHQMPIDFGRFARINAARIGEYKAKKKQAIASGAMEDDSVYVFEDLELWNLAVAQTTPHDLVAEVDDFRVIAPGFWEKLSAAERMTLERFAP